MFLNEIKIILTPLTSEGPNRTANIAKMWPQKPVFGFDSASMGVFKEKA